MSGAGGSRRGVSFLFHSPELLLRTRRQFSLHGKAGVLKPLLTLPLLGPVLASFRALGVWPGCATPPAGPSPSPPLPLPGQPRALLKRLLAGPRSHQHLLVPILPLGSQTCRDGHTHVQTPHIIYTRHTHITHTHTPQIHTHHVIDTDHIIHTHMHTHPHHIHTHAQTYYTYMPHKLHTRTHTPHIHTHIT